MLPPLWPVRRGDAWPRNGCSGGGVPSGAGDGRSIAANVWPAAAEGVATGVGVEAAAAASPPPTAPEAAAAALAVAEEAEDVRCHILAPPPACPSPATVGRAIGPGVSAPAPSEKLPGPVNDVAAPCVCSDSDCRGRSSGVRPPDMLPPPSHAANERRPPPPLLLLLPPGGSSQACGTADAAQRYCARTSCTSAVVAASGGNRMPLRKRQRRTADGSACWNMVASDEDEER